MLKLGGEGGKNLRQGDRSDGGGLSEDRGKSVL